VKGDACDVIGVFFSRDTQEKVSIRSSLNHMAI